jgi:acyl carrier protein
VTGGRLSGGEKAGGMSTCRPGRFSMYTPPGLRGSPMSMESTLQGYIEKTLLLDKGKHVGPSDALLDSGLIDSTGVFELVSFIEQEFGIKVEDEEIVPENFETIEKLARFIASKQKPAS